jgi:hypothetical protein
VTDDWSYAAEFDRPQETLFLYRRHATQLMPAEWMRRRMRRFYLQCAVATMVLSALPALADSIGNSAYRAGYGVTHGLGAGKSLYPTSPGAAAVVPADADRWPWLMAALALAAIVLLVLVPRRRRKLRATLLSERIAVYDGKNGTPTDLTAVWDRAVELRRDINLGEFLTMAPRLTAGQAEELWGLAERITDVVP